MFVFDFPDLLQITVQMICRYGTDHLYRQALPLRCLIIVAGKQFTRGRLCIMQLDLIWRERYLIPHSESLFLAYIILDEFLALFPLASTSPSANAIRTRTRYASGVRRISKDTWTSGPMSTYTRGKSRSFEPIGPFHNQTKMAKERDVGGCQQREVCALHHNSNARCVKLQIVKHIRFWWNSAYA